MKDIFLSYRRADSSSETGRIFDHLAAHFGEERLFKDVDSIPLGQDFRDTIARAVGQCKVLLAIIGDDWLDLSTDAGGGRRIDDPNDYVHVEIATALQRKIPVIPVLVEDASLPTEAQLPAALSELAFMNATKVRTDPDFRPDVERLLKQLDKYLAVLDLGGKAGRQSDERGKPKLPNHVLIPLACVFAGSLLGAGSHALGLRLVGLKTISKDAKVALAEEVVLSKSEHQRLLAAQSSSGESNVDTRAATYLHITGLDIVELGLLEPPDSESATAPKARVIIHDGTDTFSYPKNDVWELVGENMRSSSFKMAAASGRMDVILTVDGRRFARLNSNRFVVFAVGTRGAEEVSDNAFGVRATVRYEVRSEP